jgi:RsmE family RNA methyltransferase
MNLILLFEEDFVSDELVRLTGRRLAHVAAVHRGAVGDTLRVGLAGDRLGTGLVRSIDASRLEMEVTLDEDPPPPLPLTLFLALPRPKSLKKVLQAATAMGVKRLFILRSWRVEPSYWQSPALGENSVREQLILGLEQARDTILPRVEFRRLFRPFVEDELPELTRESSAFVAHPPAPAPCPRHTNGPVSLAIGPEGGFIPFEIELLARHGFEPVTLGPRVLRVEHAIPAIIGRMF